MADFVHTKGSRARPTPLTQTRAVASTHFPLAFGWGPRAGSAAVMKSSPLLLLVLGAAAALRIPTAPLPHSPTLVRPARPALAAAPPRVRAPPIALAAAAVAPVERLRTLLYKVGFASVWVQGVLTTVSGVLLLFCSSALQRASLPLLAGLVLALAGLAAACARVAVGVGVHAALAPPRPRRGAVVGRRRAPATMRAPRLAVNCRAGGVAARRRGDRRHARRQVVHAGCADGGDEPAGGGAAARRPRRPGDPQPAGRPLRRALHRAAAAARGRACAEKGA